MREEDKAVWKAQATTVVVADEKMDPQSGILSTKIPSSLTTEQPPGKRSTALHDGDPCGIILSFDRLWNSIEGHKDDNFCRFPATLETSTPNSIYDGVTFEYNGRNQLLPRWHKNGNGVVENDSQRVDDSHPFDEPSSILSRKEITCHEQPRRDESWLASDDEGSLSPLEKLFERLDLESFSSETDASQSLTLSTTEGETILSDEL